ASEDATVVIGTSLDPELKDEVRVTVVATGLNRANSRQSVRAVETKQVEMRQRPRPVVLRTGTGNEVVDYAQPEAAYGGNPRAEAPARQDNGLDYLDIPAFLRRQAD
ncbi:MAG: cell division protein FtsZ, partial [Xanthomonadaceae bacterium]|nr:cell division protein FtsZ [Xanthomonadaceae bacterium]